ncbi:MAG: rhomboid family intramembrane serine protease [Lentisphaeria bacterium]|nr:rhomboid family intramembrane serine protease [Lentisphaeria bacterium]
MFNNRNFQDFNPEEEARGGIHAMFGLIVANLVVFVIQHLMSGADIAEKFALNIYFVKQLELWRFFTAMFLHGGFMHLFFNMFGLYIFGSLAAPVLGAKRFLLLYLLSGTLGNVLWFFVNWSNPNAWLIGASGAVMGVILVAAMLMPDIPMMLLFIPFPIKLKTLAVVYIVIEVISQIGNPGSQTAYLAHIFGFVCGYLYMKIFCKECILWDPLTALFGKKDNQNGLPPGWTDASEPSLKTVSRDEVERLLIKLSREGINALTEEEQETLRKAREEMMNQR